MSDTRPMVLRSLNLPAEMDDQLRNLAFVLRRPKADLIRLFVDRGLIDMLDRLGPRPTEADLQQVANELQSGDLSATTPASRKGGARLDKLIRQMTTSAAKG